MIGHDRAWPVAVMMTLLFDSRHFFSVSAAVFIFIKNSQQQQQKHKRQEVHADLHSYFAGFRRGHEEPVQQQIL